MGKPVLVKHAGLKGSFDSDEDCHFEFEWRSKMACPHCSPDQVHSVKGQCQNGLREIQTLVNNDSLCVIQPRNKKFDGSSLVEATSEVRSIPVVYSHEGSGNQVEACDLEQEILSDRKFMAVVKQVIFLLLVLATCCVGALCSFLQLNRRYSLLESRHHMLNRVMRMMQDPESGVKLKTKLQHAKKSLQKMSKSGRQGIK